MCLIVNRVHCSFRSRQHRPNSVIVASSIDLSCTSVFEPFLDDFAGNVFSVLVNTIKSMFKRLATVLTFKDSIAKIIWNLIPNQRWNTSKGIRSESSDTDVYFYGTPCNVDSELYFIYLWQTSLSFYIQIENEIIFE